MRVVLLLVVLLVAAAALLIGLDVVSLGGGDARRSGLEGGEESELRGAEGRGTEETRLVGRAGAVEDDDAPGASDAAAEDEGEAAAIASRVAGSTPNGARLTGRVVEGEGRVPVPGVLVRLGVSNALYAYLRAERRGRFDELVARTDEEGRFAFQDVTPARGYVVRVLSPDRPSVSASKLDLRGRPARDLGDLVLPTPAAIEGRVVDGRGEGIPAARVAVTWLVENPMMIVLADPDTLPETERLVLTDEAGAFRVEALEPGVKTIVIDAGSQGQQAIRAFSVVPGDTATLPDVVFDGEGVLAGRVQWEDGRPIPDARVFAGHDGDPAVRTVETDAEGMWRIERLPPGSFSVGVLVPGLPLQLQQRLQGGQEDLVTTFASTGAIRGRVTAEASGDAVPAFRVQVERTEETGDFMMRYLRTIIDEVIGPLPVRDDDGRFLITPVPRGSYRVRIEAEGFPVATSDAVEVSAGKTPEVAIRLPQGNGLLGEIIGDEGQSVAGVRVYVAPAAVVVASRARINPAVLEDWAEDERVAAVSDGAGAFALPPQTPGVYYLLLIHDDYQPTLIANVDLQREATSAMRMRLESAGRIEGRLVDEGGSAVANEKVLLVYASGALYELETDAQGRFERKALPPGDVLALWYAIPLHSVVQAMRAARDEETREQAYEALREHGATAAAVVPGRATRVALRTGARARIEGTLRIDGGAPHGPAIVWITNEGGGRGEPADVDATGRFTALLPPGAYTFWAQSAARQWSATNVVVKDVSGQRVDLER